MSSVWCQVRGELSRWSSFPFSVPLGCAGSPPPAVLRPVLDEGHGEA